VHTTSPEDGAGNIFDDN